MGLSKADTIKSGSMLIYQNTNWDIYTENVMHDARFDLAKLKECNVKEKAGKEYNDAYN